MSEASKPTPGVWAYTGQHYDDYGCVYLEITATNGKDVEVVVGEHGGPYSESDAVLIAEAGTVHHETGLTPRQLAEQRDALAKAVEDLLHNSAPAYSGEKEMDEDFSHRYKIASDAGLAALALVKGGEK